MHRDLLGVKSRAKSDGYLFVGEPVLAGYKKIDEPGAVISIMLQLEDGQIAFGDCCDVILAGVAGRDRVFNADEHISCLENYIAPKLVNRTLGLFRPLAEEFDQLLYNDERIHTAVRYGLTQALLHAVALASHQTITQVVASEYPTQISKSVIPILVSLNRDDSMQLDRMILKEIDILPHASFTLVEQHVGLQGEKLYAYAKKVAHRIKQIGAPNYKPKIHLDLYGTLGELFKMDFELIADYLGQLQSVTSPFDLLIESPFIAQTQHEQIDAFKRLRQHLTEKHIKVKLIADEWCNTLSDIKLFTDQKAADYIQIKTPDLGGINNSIEALLYCKEKDMSVCLGGSANETDQSARITAQVALACGPDFMLSKPGLGGDEGVMILTNEMIRTLTILKHTG